MHDRVDGGTSHQAPAEPRQDVATSRRQVEQAALRRAGAQPRLEVGAAADPAEREADRVAGIVRRVLEDQSTATLLASAPVAGRIRRSTANAASDVGTSEPSDQGSSRVRRSAVIGERGGEVDDATERRVQAARGGRPLAPDVRRSMESAFGHDFGAVRLHDGPESASLNESMQATAFTLGSDVFLKNPIDTASGSGVELLAHELTHVVQQGAGRIQRSSTSLIRRHSVKAAPPAPADVEEVEEDDEVNPRGRRRSEKSRSKSTSKSSKSSTARRQVIRREFDDDNSKKPKTPQVWHMDQFGVGHKEPDQSKAPSVLHMDQFGVGHKQPDTTVLPPVLVPDEAGVNHSLVIDKTLVITGDTATASIPGSSPAPVDWTVTTSEDGQGTGTTVSANGTVSVGNNVTVDEQQLIVTATPKGAVNGAGALSVQVPLRDADYHQALADLPAFIAGGPYALPNYVTANGFGRFDATYMPSSKTLGIDMRIKFIFPEDQPGFFGFLESKKTKLAREKRQQEYISKFITHVEGAWSRKFEFENVREPQSVWSQLNPVGVDITVRPVSKNEHFLAKIMTKSSGTANVTNTAKLTMFKGSDDIQEAMTGITKSGELDRLTRAAPDMLFHANTANLTPASLRSMDFLGTYVSRLHNPAITLTVQGHGSSAQLKSDRATAVRDALTARGIAAPHQIVIQGGGGAGTKATITPSLEQNFTNMQDVSAHEFGHMLGLDDEYATDATPAGAPIETHGSVVSAFGQEFADHTQLAGIDSASVMDGGDDVRVYHYITLWDVLHQVTTKQASLPAVRFDDADWRFIG